MWKGIAVELWSDTAPGAVHAAIAAQPEQVWRQLWARGLRDATSPLNAVREAAEEGVQQRPSAGTDSSVIVAAFVLSAAHEPPRDCEDAASQTSQATVPRRRYVCVALGSGSRCLAAHSTPPSNATEAARRRLELRDGHAEVMARRGFVAFLLDLAEAQASDKGSVDSGAFLQPHYPAGVAASPSSLQWRLRDGVCVHLVCTRWMCGSLAAVAGGSGRSGHLLLRAACGCWLSPDAQAEAKGAPQSGVAETCCVVGRCVVADHHSPLNAAAPLLHCARVKPGKGRPNLSMSCTDKVWRWSTCGVQGRRRASLFPVPVALASVHVPMPASGCTTATAESALRSAATAFVWRTHQWTSAAARCPAGGPLPPPSFAFFEAAAYLAGPQAALGEGCDSSYSRSRWLCVGAATSAARKRSRDGPAEGPVSGDVACEWTGRASSQGRVTGLVLNTKAGLPQGMAARTLEQRCSSSADAPWQLCPLSRPWMRHRLQQARGSCDDSENLSLVSPTAVDGCADSCDGAMWRCVHERHSDEQGGGTADVRLLWSSAPYPSPAVAPPLPGASGDA